MQHCWARHLLKFNEGTAAFSCPPLLCSPYNKLFLVVPSYSYASMGKPERVCAIVQSSHGSECNMWLLWNNAARVRHGHYSRLKLVGSQCRKQRFLWVPALSGCKPIEGNPLCNRNLMVYVPWPYVLAWWQSSMMNVIWLFTSCIRPDIFSELDNEVFPYHYWLSLNPK